MGGTAVAATGVGGTGVGGTGVGGTGVAGTGVGGTGVGGTGVGGTGVGGTGVGGTRVGVGVGVAAGAAGVGVGNPKNTRVKFSMNSPPLKVAVVADRIPLRKNSISPLTKVASAGLTTSPLYESPLMRAGSEAYEPIRATSSMPSGISAPAADRRPE